MDKTPNQGRGEFLEMFHQQPHGTAPATKRNPLSNCALGVDMPLAQIRDRQAAISDAEKKTSSNPAATGSTRSAPISMSSDTITTGHSLEAITNDR